MFTRVEADPEGDILPLHLGARTAPTIGPIVTVFAAVLSGTIVAAVAVHQISSGGSPIAGARPWSTGLAAMAFVMSGAAITRRLPSNPLGWLLLGIALSETLDTTGWVLAQRSHVAACAHQIFGWPPISLTILLALLFPTGTLPSRRWRPVLWAAIAGIVIPSLGLAAIGILEHDRLRHLGRPLQGTAALWMTAAQAGCAIGLVAGCLALTSLLGRWRSATGVERQQLKWFGIATIVFFLGLIGEIAFPGALYLGLAAIPVAVAIAILRFRLYDLDLVLNRTLVYGILTAGLVLFYVFMVGSVSSQVSAKGWLGRPLAATGVIALGFQPARQWLQRRIDRLVYGDRGDPFSVVSALGQLLSTAGTSEDVLPCVVETISCKLQLPFVAVEVTAPDGSTVTVEHGRRIVEPLAFRMIYQGAEEGRLLVGPRSPGEPFSAAESRLLATLAHQVAPVAHSVQLTCALRRSRERAIRGREEERRRLSRDLHDGLGPILSGLRLGIEGTARQLPATAPEVDLLNRLAGQAAEGTIEVRRLINDLRPDALDSLGLVEAIRQTAERFAATQLDGHPTRFEVEVVGLPGNLPAAVEVTTHWIVTEAMHNVLRHAKASRCVVLLSCDGRTLEVVVDDDGDGLTAPLPNVANAAGGVGTISMRERAEEIGGHCSIANGPLGGARVLAHLPLGTP